MRLFAYGRKRKKERMRGLVKEYSAGTAIEEECPRRAEQTPPGLGRRKRGRSRTSWMEGEEEMAW